VAFDVRPEPSNLVTILGLLLGTIIKSQVCYEERILLDTKCQSLPARFEPLAVGGFPSALDAPRQRVGPKRLHSAGLTSCGTRHHTACTLRQGPR
jgi:hypothetical protein